YGVPGHHHEEGAEEPLPGEEEEEAPVRIDLQQRRLDMGGSLRMGRAVEHLRARFGLADYEHVELEGEDVGTRFLNNQWEGRLEAHHREFGPSRGAMGLQFSSRDFEAIGEEAFVPRSETTQFGFFAFEEMDLDAARVQLGARFERQRSTERADDTERVHNGLSLSAGLNVPVGERLTLALSASRSVKMPTPEELYSNGPHLATSSFEVGNPDLDTETALSLDASARLTMGRVQGGLTGFVNAFNGFIFPRFTGVEVDGLQEVVYSQADARYVGFELDGNIELYHVGAQHLALLFGADYVRATLTETDQPLPRIPPLSLRGGFEFDAGPLRAGLEARHVARQDRVAAFETETDGYTLLDGSVSYRLIQGAVAHDLTLSASNLTDEEARVHTSLLKDLAPMPGREVRLAYRLSF
ncbi:MAG: TonB-dependent receptor, partial [Gemmatimonadetes bacterium]|nr:TonB-dependent receptor [Gemmatimonadota bacterium]